VKEGGFNEWNLRIQRSNNSITKQENGANGEKEDEQATSEDWVGLRGVDARDFVHEI
jgi:hypothetical protein